MTSKKKILKNKKSERMIHGVSEKIEELDHEERYKYASKFTKNKIVVDAACGSGYGSVILSKNAKKVYAFDIDDYMIKEYCNKKYSNIENIEFNIQDLTKPSFIKDESVDAVVSFETIEHTYKQKEILSEFYRVLKPGGQLIISTPDHDVMKKVNKNNPFHVKELNIHEAEKLLKFNNFKLIEKFGQRIYKPQSYFMKIISFFIKIVVYLDVFNLRLKILSNKAKKKISKNLSKMDMENYELHEIENPNNKYIYIVYHCIKE